MKMNDQREYSTETKNRGDGNNASIDCSARISVLFCSAPVRREQLVIDPSRDLPFPVNESLVFHSSHNKLLFSFHDEDRDD